MARLVVALLFIVLALTDSLRQIQSGRVPVNPVDRNRIQSTIRDLERDQNRNTPDGAFRAPAGQNLHARTFLMSLGVRF
jgi:hypothetical protein